jgi:hypothetical protein
MRPYDLTSNRDIFGINSTSDNGCDDKTSESDSESLSESRSAGGHGPLFYQIPGSLSTIPALVARLTDSAPLEIICSWCQPMAERLNPVNRGASHGICPSCEARLQSDLDALMRSRG